MDLYLSVIIPVYNRPDEIDELLESFTKQDFDKAYEIIIVEDGSQLTCKEVIKKYKHLNIAYFYKENSGPGDSRNYGMNKAMGNYFIILDSDVILPTHYLTTVNTYLSTNYVDCFGGADAAHKNFSKKQKAINYAMTSFLSTGGLRGAKLKLQKFEPRSFNMGISKEVFKKVHGFGRIYPGEDPDLTLRIEKSGFTTSFLPNAFVFHKRRTSWSEFYTQVKKFGMVRPILISWYPDKEKISFYFPTLFIIFAVFSLLLALLSSKVVVLYPFLSYLILLLLHSSLVNKSITIGFLSVYAVIIQFFGYGTSFLKSSYYIRCLKRKPEKQFPELFFKKQKL
ncbi:MAG: glycosyltransferase [Tenacibaculum sp.]